MALYSFTVQVSGIDTKGERYEDALYRAGCTDALVAVIDGKLFLDFDREAPSYERAVASAREAIEEAGGRVENIERIVH